MKNPLNIKALLSAINPVPAGRFKLGSCFTVIIGLWLACADGPIYSPRAGGPYLVLTGVRTPGPAEVELLFSEPVSPYNNEPGFFDLANASTGATLALSTVSVAGQTITLHLAPPAYARPYQLVAGHVYDVHFNVQARDNRAVADSTGQFLADFFPPPAPEIAAWQDSAGNILLLWTPDNRVGNTELELWKKTVINREEFTALIARLDPWRSAYWHTKGFGQTAYALKAVNEFGTSGWGSWAIPADAGTDTFTVLGTCLKDDTSLAVPAGYALRTGIANCERVEYYNDSLQTTLIWEITEKGMVKIQADSTGAVTMPLP